MATAYSQRDTEWAQDGLGTSRSPSLGQAGCLVTSMASVVTDLTGAPFSPGYLNDWLAEKNGFAQGNLFTWYSVGPLGLKLKEMIRTQLDPAPVEKLIQSLQEGLAVVVMVDSTPGGKFNQHWVRLLSLDENDGDIMDPWQMPGKELIKLSKYFAPGWTPARAIFASAIYAPTPAARGLAEAVPSGADDDTISGEGLHQPTLCIRPED